MNGTTVGKLIYEVTAMIDGSFSSTLTTSKTQVSQLAGEMSKSEKSAANFRRSIADLNKEFQSGKIGFGEYTQGLKTIGDQQNAAKRIDEISTAQKKLVDQLAKGKISVGEFNKKLSELEGGSQGIIGTLSKMKFAFAGIVAAITGGAIRGLVDFTNKAAAVSQLEGSFSKLASGIGADTNEILATLQKFSGGTVANAELVAAANRAMVLGVAKSTEDFGTLMGIARIRARDMGISVTQAFGDIVTGIGRGSALILDNLGIIINQTAAEEQYAASLKISTKELTQAQKNGAIRSAVMKSANEEIKRAGELTLTYSERMAAFNATIDNTKIAIGKTLLPAVESLLSGYSDLGQSTEELTAKLKEQEKAQDATEKTFYQIVNGVKAFGQALLFLLKTVALVVTTVFNGAAVIGAAFVDIAKAISSPTKAIGVLADAFKKAFSGDFDGALKTVKTGFKEAFDFSTTKNVFKNFTSSIGAYSETITKSFDAIGTSGQKALGKGFVSVAQSSAAATAMYQERIRALDKQLAEGAISQSQYDKAISQITTKLNGAKEANAGLAVDTDKASKAAETAAKKADTLVGKLDDIRVKANEASTELGGKLAESMQKLGDNILESTTSTGEKLATMVVDAQAKIDEIQSQGNVTEADQKRLTEYQAILDARVGYEERASKRIEELKAKVTAAGLDAEQLGLDRLTTTATFQEQIDEQKRLASLDEFTRFEELEAKKLAKMVENSITELTILKNKYDTQKQYEEELALFVETSSARQASAVDAFANSAIQKYGEMAAALRNVISLQGQLGGIGGGGAVPQFHEGGYVGTRGGEVHPGEYVLPANLVRANPNLISSLEASRSSGQVNNINITANGTSGTDFDSVAQQLTWRLRQR